MMIGLRPSDQLPTTEEFDLACALDNLASYLRVTDLRRLNFDEALLHLQQLKHQRDAIFFKQGAR